jgi:hypothetical protein
MVKQNAALGGRNVVALRCADANQLTNQTPLKSNGWIIDRGRGAKTTKGE